MADQYPCQPFPQCTKAGGPPTLPQAGTPGGGSSLMGFRQPQPSGIGQPQGGGGPDIMSKLGGIIPRNADGSVNWTAIATLGLAGYGTYTSAKDQGNANAFMQHETQRRDMHDARAIEAYDAKKPLRDQSMAKLGELMNKKGRASSYLDQK